MGCNLSKIANQISESEITPIEKDNNAADKTGKSFVAFDIQLDPYATSGDNREETKSVQKMEPRKPNRLTPIPNPPILTTEMIEEKLKKAEEKREQLLAARRLSCQKSRLTPTLLLQGRTPANSTELETKNEDSSWIFNWSGDDALTDEQLEAILEAEAQQTNESVLN